MDLLKLLRAFEELLFEVTAWLVYYPRTLWRMLRRPLQTMRDAELELERPLGTRYDDAMSPPLFLLITIVLLHGASLAVGTPALDEARTTRAFGSDQNLVIARSLLFPLFPLTAAVVSAAHASRTLGRAALRPHFFAQCYLTAPYAIAVTAGGLLFASTTGAPRLVGAGGMAVATLLDLGVQTAQFRRRLRLGAAHAAGLTLAAFAAVSVLVVGATFVIGAVQRL